MIHFGRLWNKPKHEKAQIVCIYVSWGVLYNKYKLFQDRYIIAEPTRLHRNLVLAIKHDLVFQMQLMISLMRNKMSLLIRIPDD